jgi:hypothetical protein
VPPGLKKAGGSITSKREHLLAVDDPHLLNDMAVEVVRRDAEQ